ncbi:uncharacterized protein LOC127872161 [Dreissena polymorpha]|uniref:uncharacterized protein LOC127872161 n=1 Tax=Dreissena polymorpha TaxID=45954 RepID=UPI0022642B50|nr:uncharacterized protein LOC127872161 [Dreissena polymorpha]
MGAGNTHNDQTDLLPTAAFHTGSRKKTIYNRKSPKCQKEIEQRMCVFCEKTHQGECKTTAVSPVCAGGRYVEANILMDEGAQRSFITQKLADKLQLQHDGTDVINLSTFGDLAHSVRRLHTATINIVATDGCMIPIRQIVGDQVVRGNGPTAVSSRIGYFLSGPLPESANHGTSVMDVITAHVASDVSRFWDIETLGIKPEDAEQACAVDIMKSYQDTCLTFSDGKYTARLPWKEEHATLPTNYEIARKRTESSIRRLSKDPATLACYSNIINDQERCGFIERVENDSTSARIHYIPNHGVKKDSATTPIRIVYDCSCRQVTGSASLNDCLMSTPPELNDLTLLLMKFRIGQYGVVSDIEKAILNVMLHEDDRDVTRFLWLSDPTDPCSSLTTYRFRAVLFGATCSPFILSATILKHLTLNKDNTAASTICNDLYVDNVVSSFTSETDVLKYFRQARELMAAGGFNLKSWTSNSSKLRTMAEAEGVVDRDAVIKVLGLLWEPEIDQMSFVMRSINSKEKATKRRILQQTSTIYDPLDMLAPVTIRAKLLIQDLWKRKYAWDTPIPEREQNTWLHIAEDLNEAMTTSLPRQYFPDNPPNMVDEDYVLHVFVDASTRAYGAVAYLNTSSNSAFVFAKN